MLLPPARKLHLFLALPLRIPEEADGIVALGQAEGAVALQGERGIALKGKVGAFKGRLQRHLPLFADALQTAGQVQLGHRFPGNGADAHGFAVAADGA